MVGLLANLTYLANVEPLSILPHQRSPIFLINWRRDGKWTYFTNCGVLLLGHFFFCFILISVEMSGKRDGEGIGNYFRLDFLLLMFWRICSYSFICWFGSLTQKRWSYIHHFARLQLPVLLWRTSPFTIKPGPSKKVCQIQFSANGPLFTEFTLLPSGYRTESKIYV